MISQARIERFAMALSVLCTVTLCGADLRELPVEGIGFIGPVSTGNNPETAACDTMRYSGSVGFPYLNRSLVVDLGGPKLVHGLKLLDDRRDDGGTSPTMSEGGLSLYSSLDGHTFAPYRGSLQITVRSGAAEGVFDVVSIDGFSLFTRYIKLHADRADEQWDFANRNLQKMVQVFQDASLTPHIERLRLPRYSVGRVVVTAEIRMPSADLGRLMLHVNTQDEELAVLPVATDGTCHGVLDVSARPWGVHVVDARLKAETGMVLATSSARTCVVGGLVRNPPLTPPLAGRPAQTVLLNDLGRLADFATAHWTPGAFIGPDNGEPTSVLIAGSGSEAVTIRLPVAGWHAVGLGLVGGDSEIDVRLGDEATVRRRLEVWREHDRAKGLGETFVGCVQLGGTALTLSPVEGKPCRLAFIRLSGLSAEQVRLAEAAAEPNREKRVTVNNDGFSMFFSGTDSLEQLQRIIDRYAGLNLYSYDYCTGSDATCTYDTKVGTVFGTYKNTFWRQGDRRAHDAIRKLIAEGNDPLRVIIDRCREKGMRVNVSFRACANYPPPMADTFNGELYWKHQNCRIRTRSGKLSCRLSYAYPEVRAFRLAIIREAVGYGPDGLHLDFLRHPPFVGYDPPLVDAYRAKYGADPLDMPEDDRWYTLCAEVMTDFVQDVRDVVDAEGKRQGRKLTLSASFDVENYREQGLDVSRWVRDGLVDQISPGRHGLGGITFPISQFADMVRGTPCALFPRLEHTITGHDPTPESERGEVTYEREHMTLNLYRARALQLYADGADGIYLFNTSGLGLIDPLSNIAGLHAWNEFERPFIGWFDNVRILPAD